MKDLITSVTKVISIVRLNSAGCPLQIRREFAEMKLQRKHKDSIIFCRFENMYNLSLFVSYWKLSKMESTVTDYCRNMHFNNFNCSVTETIQVFSILLVVIDISSIISDCYSKIYWQNQIKYICFYGNNLKFIVFLPSPCILGQPQPCTFIGGRSFWYNHHILTPVITGL